MPVRTGAAQHELPVLSTGRFHSKVRRKKARLGNSQDCHLVVRRAFPAWNPDVTIDMEHRLTDGNMRIPEVGGIDEASEPQS